MHSTLKRGSGVKSSIANARVWRRRLWKERCVVTWCLIIWLALVPGSLVQAMRPGLDIEDFNPPFTRTDPHIVQALAAYDAENDREAERVARQLLAAQRARRKRDGLAQVEVRFILARAQADYLMQLIDRIMADDVLLAPREDAARSWLDGVRELARNSVWGTGGCVRWYLDKTGTPTLNPITLTELKAQLGRPDYADFEVTPRDGS